MCDGVPRQSDDKQVDIPPRLTPSPPPEPAVKLVETSVQTQPERRSVSRASSTGIVDEESLPNGRRAKSEDRSSKVASSSRTRLDIVQEEGDANDGKRKSDGKAAKGEKRARREAGSPKPNGRVDAASDAEEEEGQEAVAAASSSPSTAPGKKNKRGTNASKGAPLGSNGSAKGEKGSASAWVPSLTGKAKNKQVASQNIAKLKGHKAEVFVSAWNPAVPGLIASGAGDATVRIWDLGPSLAGGDLADFDTIAPTVCKHLPSTHAKDVSALSWNPDGTLLASGSYDGILRLWTPQGDLHLVMSMHQGPIFAVRWNRKGNFILSGSADGTAIVWDLNSGKVRQQFSSHSDSVLDIDWLTGSIVGQPDNAVPSTAADNTLATCSADNSINILRLGENKPVKTLKGHTDEVNAIRFDATGTLLASVSDDSTARIWSMDAIFGPGFINGSSAKPAMAGASNTGKRSSTTPRPARGGSVDQMDVDDTTSSVGDTSGGAGELMGQNNGTNGLCRFVLAGHKKDIFAVAWAPFEVGGTDPRLLATASFDNTARIWNAEDGSCLRVFTEHTDSVYSVCFSPDRRFLVTGGMDHRLFISSVETGEVVMAHAAGGGIFDVAWHAGKARRSIEGAEGAGLSETTRVKEEVEGPSMADAPSVKAARTSHHLALSQADKTLTVIELSGL